MKKIFPLILIFLLAFNARTSAQVLSGEEIQNLVVGEVEDAPHFIDCAGIESPGLTSSPAIGEFVAAMMKEKLGELEVNQQ